eukprot:COSAG02_NODE_59441_length_274_cov_0.742857_1_plen_51_part_10
MKYEELQEWVATAVADWLKNCCGSRLFQKVCFQIVAESLWAQRCPPTHREG